MLRNYCVVLVGLALVPFAGAQQSTQPQVKVNVLNVCSPSPEEQQEIASALEHIPKQPLFSQEFEIDRGRSLLEQSPDFLQPRTNAKVASSSDTADWVRIRREFSVQAMFSTVQYSFSRDPKNMVETLVFHVRDPRDLLQVSVEDSAATVTTPSSMLAADTPASRIKLERFGKPSVVLARCSGSEGTPPPDQSAYEPLFQSASAISANYRGLLGARHTVPEELGRIGGSGARTTTPAKSATAAKKPASGDK